MSFNSDTFERGTKVHLLWVDWDKKEQLTLSLQYRLFSDIVIKRKEINVNDKIDFSVTGYICIGYPDAEDNIILCKENKQLAKGIQCIRCTYRDTLLGCSRCKGVECINKRAWDYCVGTPHIVYLAGFHNGLVKVGTSKKDRFERRLLEQSASTACVIAYTQTEMRAKYIENKISKECQVPESIKEKIKAESINVSNIEAQKTAIEN